MARKEALALLRPEPDAGSIGERLRLERKRRGITMQEVAQAAGISPSWLSRLESDQAKVPYDTLKRVLDVLGLAIEDVIHEQPRAVSLARRAITRRGEASRFESDEYVYDAHGAEIARKAMLPLEMQVRARSADEFDHWSHHPGEEFVYVLSGSIRIHTEEYAPFVLSAGESAYFDSGMGHCYVSVSDEDARILSVSCGQANGAPPAAPAPAPGPGKD